MLYDINACSLSRLNEDREIEPDDLDHGILDSEKTSETTENEGSSARAGCECHKGIDDYDCESDSGVRQRGWLYLKIICRQLRCLQPVRGNAM